MHKRNKLKSRAQVSKNKMTNFKKNVSLFQEELIQVNRMDHI
jgi:hypothetical protein